MVAVEGCELAGVAARAPATRGKARADWTDTPIYASLTDMIALDTVDAITIAMPSHTRRAPVPQRIEAGLRVIADKPFAPRSQGARDLGVAANAKGAPLGVYHVRRFVADIQKLKKVVASAFADGPRWCAYPRRRSHGRII
ncbi:MAG: Gfo/Idh/MocA family oxidoreductase [Albidovulum sp.]|nr:Gfo/Idh/MocA family oxidoreductase [Albidovulum sp.]